RAAGIDAWAWLPGELNAKALADYVRRAGVDVIVTSTKMGHPGGPLEDLQRARPGDIEKTAGRQGVEVVVVDDEAKRAAEGARDPDAPRTRDRASRAPAGPDRRLGMGPGCTGRPRRRAGVARLRRRPRRVPTEPSAAGRAAPPAARAAHRADGGRLRGPPARDHRAEGRRRGGAEVVPGSDPALRRGGARPARATARPGAGSPRGAPLLRVPSARHRAAPGGHHPSRGQLRGTARGGGGDG